MAAHLYVVSTTVTGTVIVKNAGAKVVRNVTGVMFWNTVRRSGRPPQRLFVGVTPPVRFVIPPEHTATLAPLQYTSRHSSFPHAHRNSRHRLSTGYGIRNAVTSP